MWIVGHECRPNSPPVPQHCTPVCLRAGDARHEALKTISFVLTRQRRTRHAGPQGPQRPSPDHQEEGCWRAPHSCISSAWWPQGRGAEAQQQVWHPVCVWCLGGAAAGTPRFVTGAEALTHARAPARTQARAHTCCMRVCSRAHSLALPAHTTAAPCAQAARPGVQGAAGPPARGQAAEGARVGGPVVAPGVVHAELPRLCPSHFQAMLLTPTRAFPIAITQSHLHHQQRTHTNTWHHTERGARPGQAPPRPAARHGPGGQQAQHRATGSVRGRARTVPCVV